MLISRLPRGSATRAEVLGGEENDWTISNHLAADQIDATLMLTWVTAGSKKNPRPDPIPRPGRVTARDRRTDLTGTEIERRLLEQRERRKR